jgi:hypothetical protein
MAAQPCPVDLRRYARGKLPLASFASSDCGCSSVLTAFGVPGRGSLFVKCDRGGLPGSQAEDADDGIPPAARRRTPPPRLPAPRPARRRHRPACPEPFRTSWAERTQRPRISNPAGQLTQPHHHHRERSCVPADAIWVRRVWTRRVSGCMARRRKMSRACSRWWMPTVMSPACRWHSPMPSSASASSSG